MELVFEFFISILLGIIGIIPARFFKIICKLELNKFIAVILAMILSLIGILLSFFVSYFFGFKVENFSLLTLSIIYFGSYYILKYM